MRFVIALTLSLAFQFGAADDLGTKANPVNSGVGGSSMGIMPFVNVLLALGIVYGLLRFAMPKMMVRMNKRLVPGVSSGIQIEESAAFAGGSLYIVSARGKTLLLAVGSQGVQSLADLTGPEAKSPAPEIFAEIVDREMSAPVFVPKAVIHPEVSDPIEEEAPAPELRPSPIPAEAREDWAIALERLERLAN